MLTRRQFATGTIVIAIRAGGWAVIWGRFATDDTAAKSDKRRVDAALTVDVDGPYLAPTNEE